MVADDHKLELRRVREEVSPHETRGNWIAARQSLDYGQQYEGVEPPN
jgi:hypothetical protein